MGLVSEFWATYVRVRVMQALRGHFRIEVNILKIFKIMEKQRRRIDA